MIVPLALIGVLGAALGSFLSVVAHRLPRGESIVSPRSACATCGEPVRPRDNIPIVSWLLLRGRCRHCGQAISPRYPALEAVTAAAFVAVASVGGIDSSLIAELAFVTLLIAVSVIDIEHGLIPNKILLPGAIWAVGATLAVAPGELGERLIAGAGAGAFLLVAVIAYPGGMGMGDVKLAGVMGLYLGIEVVPALAFAFASGTAVGLVIVARRGVEARKQKVPFGPYLAAGALAAILVGTSLLDWYVDSFL